MFVWPHMRTCEIQCCISQIVALAVHKSCSSANFTQEATTMTSERDNPFHIAQQQFDTAAELLDLPQDIREVLRVPQRELTVRFPVRMDDGTTKVYTGYRVQ